MSDNVAQQQDMSATPAINLRAFADVWRRAERWFEDNRDVIQEALLVVPAYLVEDVGAEDSSGVRAKLLNKDSLQVFTKHGWHPTADMALAQIGLLARELDDPEDERVASARQVFINKFRAEAENIEQRLVRSFPTRSSIISDAFQAHRGEEYNLSVPVFLAQADGIWYDRCGTNIFRKTRNAIKKAANSISHGIMYEMISSLGNDWQLGRHGRPSASFKGLNRHQVLHGTVTDYGTEENSLKAISFLNFCAFVLEERPGKGDH